MIWCSPGSGCSTFLKTIAGVTHGFHVSKEATLNYQGIQPKDMRSAFRGEAIYTAEVDQHFPQLTVDGTLYFAARARCPRNLPDGVSRKEYAEHLRDVTMAMFGISHTKNTRVGDNFLRGVSGGERKRVRVRPHLITRLFSAGTIAHEVLTSQALSSSAGLFGPSPMSWVEPPLSPSIKLRKMRTM